MKTKAKTKLRFQYLPKDYESLCRVFLPRPIHDGAEYDNTAEVADAMVLWHEDFTPDQRDYFDLLCSLIEAYDEEHVKWPKLKGRDILQHFLDEHDLTAAGLSRILGGSRNLGAMILRGDRNLTVAHIRKLAAHFKVSPSRISGAYFTDSQGASRNNCHIGLITLESRNGNRYEGLA